MIVEKMKISEVMKRATFIKFEHKMIMKLDLSNLVCQSDVARVVDYLIGMVARMPKHSVVGLVVFEGVPASSEIEQELIRLIESSHLYFRFSAFIACDDQSKKLADAISNRFETANLPVFNDEDAAKKWLFAQLQ